MSAKAEDSKSSPDGQGTTVSLDDAVAMAVQSHQEGRLAEATSIYRQVLAAVPDHVDALHFLGVAEQQMGRPEAALELMNHALALVPEHADALNNRGNVFRSLFRLDEAESDYRHALTLRPGDPNTLSNLGTVLRARGDGEGAVAAFREVVAKNPDHAPAWQNLGGALEDLDRSAEALDAYREAARLAPDSADSYLDLGKWLYTQAHYKEAAEMYRQCLTLSPDDPRARHLLAACTGEATPLRASDEYVRAEFDNFARTYDAKLDRLEYRGPALVGQALAQMVGDRKSSLVVLDAGCGTGLCGPVLRPRASVLVGVDLSASMVALARDRGVYDDLVVEELTTFLRKHVRTSDLIVSADTLVYFGDLSEVVGAAAEALRPGGALIFTVERAEPGEAPAGYRLRPHGRYSHTREYVTGVLAEAGFVDSTIREVSARKEAKQWVPGWLVCARIKKVVEG